MPKVIVILLGIVKLTYNHWKLRKYTKIAATKAVLKNEMQHSQSVRRGRARDVPFGIRAIESGVEVDGVWISRPNTPASSIPGSPVLSATPARQVTGPQDVHLDRVSSASNTAYFETSNATQSRCQTDATPGPSVRTPINRPSRKHEPPPTSDHQARGRPTYQPRRASHLRYSNSHDPEDSESTIETDGRPASSDRNGKRPESRYIEIRLVSLVAEMFERVQDMSRKAKTTAPRPPYLALLGTVATGISLVHADRPPLPMTFFTQNTAILKQDV